MLHEDELPLGVWQQTAGGRLVSPHGGRQTGPSQQVETAQTHPGGQSDWPPLQAESELQQTLKFVQNDFRLFSLPPGYWVAQPQPLPDPPQAVNPFPEQTYPAPARQGTASGVPPRDRAGR